jgi:hypothetical protein
MTSDRPIDSAPHDDETRSSSSDAISAEVESAPFLEIDDEEPPEQSQSQRFEIFVAILIVAIAGYFVANFMKVDSDPNRGLHQRYGELDGQEVPYLPGPRRR